MVKFWLYNAGDLLVYMESGTCFGRANVRFLKLAVLTHAMPSVVLVFNFSPACEVGLLCPEVSAGAVDLIPSVCVHLICCCKSQNRLNYLSVFSFKTCRDKILSCEISCYYYLRCWSNSVLEILC